MQAPLSFTSEARFLRFANKHLRQMSPVLPGQFHETAFATRGSAATTALGGNAWVQQVE